jgi:GTPase SAR1 family protein
MTFGQLVIGPAGCGKSTYCNAFVQFMAQLERPAIRVNLDFGNVSDADIDVRDLISVEDAMKELDLGPNGAMLYCMDYLEKNIDC